MKLGGMLFLGGDTSEQSAKGSPRNFSPIRESFLPQKFLAMQYPAKLVEGNDVTVMHTKRLMCSRLNSI